MQMVKLWGCSGVGLSSKPEKCSFCNEKNESYEYEDEYHY